MKSASNRSNLKNQQGRGNLGCLFSFLLLGAIGYLGYKFIPPYVSHYELKDALDELAVYEISGISVSNKGTAVDTQDLVINKAREMGIKLEKQDIKIERTTDKIFIHVNYSVPIDLPGGVYQLKFDFTSHN
jgi:hypothetical protein